MQHIGTRIASVRENAGMTQNSLAKKIHTTQSAIARIESGKQNVSSEMIKKISKALNRNLLTPTPGSMNLEILGGRKLSGTIETNTSKNGAVGLLCASLLNKGKTTLRHMPKIEEVYRLIEVLESIGVKVEWNQSDLTIVPPGVFNLKQIDIEAARKTRSIVMFIGPLMHYFKKFSLPQSGGCKLGSRTVRPHFFALEHFGVQIDTTEDAFKVSVAPKCPDEIILYESGDTVTENALFAAARSECTTTIKDRKSVV